jgi:hypothetical protein
VASHPGVRLSLCQPTHAWAFVASVTIPEARELARLVCVALEGLNVSRWQQLTGVHAAPPGASRAMRINFGSALVAHQCSRTGVLGMHHAGRSRILQAC